MNPILLSVAATIIHKVIKELRLPQRWRNKTRFQKVPDIFVDGYISNRKYFYFLFGKIPNDIYFNNIDVKTFTELLHKTFSEQMIQCTDWTTYDWADQAVEIDSKLIAFKNEIFLDIDDDSVSLYYGEEDETVKAIKQLAINHHVETKIEPSFEINILQRNRTEWTLKKHPITPTELSIKDYYNDDFEDVHQTILDRLNTNNDKGIVLLHGLPGTGKTTYIRYLIGQLRKKVIFMNPSLAEDLTSPEFMSFLVEHPNTVIVVEDAEHLIMDRNISGRDSVSSLLNMSDGLLSDFLNIQLVCTFNMPLDRVDKALLRKGRLIALYDFGKLAVDKANRLAAQLKLRKKIYAPVTLAELMNKETCSTEVYPTHRIGFKIQQ